MRNIFRYVKLIRLTTPHRASDLDQRTFAILEIENFEQPRRRVRGPLCAMLRCATADFSTPRMRANTGSLIRVAARMRRTSASP